MDVVKKYLEEKSWEFDFTDDCCTENSKYRDLSGYEKYFTYKTVEKKTDPYYAGDPDSESELLQKIYKHLWPELKDKDYMKDKEKIYSDTMTSVQHTLSRYYKDTFPDEIKEYRSKNPRQKFSARMCKTMYEQYSTVSKTLNENFNLKKFISCYHTLGNYCPVPAGFNVARSGTGYSSNYDYWDLTLMRIKKYYDIKKELSLQVTDVNATNEIAMLLHCNGIIDNCKKWLDGYNGWDDFVEKNYFQDYIYADNGKEVIPFCEGHSWENNEIGNYDEFFKNVSNRIEKRSKRMIAALEKKINNSNR